MKINAHKMNLTTDVEFALFESVFNDWVQGPITADISAMLVDICAKYNIRLRDELEQWQFEMPDSLYTFLQLKYTPETHTNYHDDQNIMDL